MNRISVNQVIQLFEQAIQTDLGAKVRVLPDGEIQQFDDPDEKKGNLNCWYVLHLDERPFGVYGNRVTNETYTWDLQNSDILSSQRRLIFDHQKHEADLKRKQQCLLAYNNAARQARLQIEISASADPSHPYLIKKNVNAHNLRQSGERLLVQLIDTSGKLWSLQKINNNGYKRFLYDGRLAGTFSLLGKMPTNNDRIYICEGWATAATIHEQTGSSVVAAMTAGNLASVLLNLRIALPPSVEMILAADNDRNNENNPGIRLALKAAKVVGASVTWPTFPCSNCNCSDFNDLVNCRNKRGVV